MNENVRIGKETVQTAAVRWILQVQGDALLVGIEVEESPLISGSALPSKKGPRLRVMSPPGGSTFTTSAPSSVSSLAAYAAATPCPHSTTEIPARGRCAGCASEPAE
ncbi:MAG TPA: hypothetical protein VGY99_32255 [Candidatus Binataceae bacterium]|nr:hypothetical protein [Candidatus Binataceae bacterium]